MTPSREEIFDDLQAKVKVLKETIWEKHGSWPVVEEWLDQFAESGDLRHDEKLQALFLLTHFLFFGTTEVRALLKSLYRDYIRHRIIALIRRSAGDTRDPRLLDIGLRYDLKRTRFVSFGNPSESSAMLLYFFRQENDLPKELFISAIELFSAPTTTSGATIGNADIKHYIFLDDLCGSGDQAGRYARRFVDPLRKLAPGATLSYYALFGMTCGINLLRNLISSEGMEMFDVVEAVVELDESFRCFSDDSRIYARAPDHHDRGIAKTMFTRYGEILYPEHPLGFRDSQLLLGFSHNTPDNTLPIFWWDPKLGGSWTPLFRRYAKISW